MHAPPIFCFSGTVFKNVPFRDTGRAGGNYIKTTNNNKKVKAESTRNELDYDNKSS